MQGKGFTTIRNVRLARLAAAIVAFVLFMASGAAAQEAAELVQPIVTRELFERMCRQVGLSEQDRFITDTAYGEYAEAARALVADAQTRAEQVGLRSIRDVVQGKSQAGLEQLAKWEQTVLEEYSKIWPQADELFNRLVGDVQMSVSGESAAKFPAALRTLHRSLMLQSRQPPGLEPKAYLGDGVDLVQLAESAMKPGQELQQFSALAPELPDATDRQTGARAEIAAVLGAYEAQMDDAIVATYAAHRAAPLARKRAEVARDAAALKREDEAAFDRWYRLFQINRQTADRVGVLAASISPEAQQAWLDRVDAAICPWLFAAEFSDRAHDWIMKQEQLTDEQRRQAEAAYGPFVAKRRDLRRGAIELIVRLRTQVRGIVSPTSTGVRRAPPEREAERLRAQGQIDAKLYELIALEAGVRASLTGLLTDAQRKEMNETTSAASRSRRGR